MHSTNNMKSILLNIPKHIYLVLSLFQITIHFDFIRYIIFAMYLDTVYI
jgi:hypothetical protein